MQNVQVPIKLLSTIGGDATFRASRRQGGEIGRGDGREDIVAVGRKGVACRGRRERKKGDFDPLLANGIFTEGGPRPLVPPSRFLLRSYVRLTMRDATTPDVCTLVGCCEAEHT